MSKQDNPYYPAHDFPMNWSADDLAAAVPLRLSDRLALGLVRFDTTTPAANAAPSRRRNSYLPATTSPLLRVR